MDRPDPPTRSAAGGMPATRGGNGATSPPSPLERVVMTILQRHEGAIAELYDRFEALVTSLEEEIDGSLGPAEAAVYGVDPDIPFARRLSRVSDLMTKRRQFVIDRVDNPETTLSVLIKDVDDWNDQRGVPLLHGRLFRRDWLFQLVVQDQVVPDPEKRVFLLRLGFTEDAVKAILGQGPAVIVPS